jgi:Amt family ammonium transporter
MLLIPSGVGLAQDAAAVESDTVSAQALDSTETNAETSSSVQTDSSTAPHLAGTIDTGSTAWLLVSAALVFFMMPGLALFYGGMVRAKNVLNMFMCVMVCVPIVTIQWVLCGYSLTFAVDPLISIDGGQNEDGSDKPRISFMSFDSKLLMLQSFSGVDPSVPENYVGKILTTGDTEGAGDSGVPELLFAMFQMMFAIITPALIVGALAERVKFSAWCIFVILWATLVYDPVAHCVWNVTGWLFQKGVMDFAGGTVVHVLAGASALALISDPAEATGISKGSVFASQHRLDADGSWIPDGRLVWFQCRFGDRCWERISSCRGVRCCDGVRNDGHCRWSGHRFVDDC